MAQLELHDYLTRERRDEDYGTARMRDEDWWFEAPRPRTGSSERSSRETGRKGREETAGQIKVSARARPACRLAA